jgi:hypothetical protein
MRAASWVVYSSPSTGVAYPYPEAFGFSAALVRIDLGLLAVGQDEAGLALLSHLSHRAGAGPLEAIVEQLSRGFIQL